MLSRTKKIRKPRKDQVSVSTTLRLEILILINEFGLSCYQAAKVLDLPYTNAKVIYRVFRDENRVIGSSSFARNGLGCLTDNNSML